jgi:hypothetical protein
MAATLEEKLFSATWPERLDVCGRVCVCIFHCFGGQNKVDCVSGGSQRDNGGRESDYPCSRVSLGVRGLINVLIPTYFKCTFSGQRNMPFPRPPDPHYPTPNGKRCADWKLWPLLTAKLYNELRLGFTPLCLKQGLHQEWGIQASSSGKMGPP